MRQRDKAILTDLQKFRCMSRNDIIDLHFSDLKNPVTSCNTVLKRLRRDGYIEVNMSHQPFVYFPHPNPIRKSSQKIAHFLGIVDVYKQLLPHDKPKRFDVEPKYGKGYMEPDIFTIWRRAPFFIEYQNSVYSTVVMQEKIKRYEAYFYSQEWQRESWQPEGNKIFPPILIFTNRTYSLNSNLRIFQATSIEHFLKQTVFKTK